MANYFSEQWKADLNARLDIFQDDLRRAAKAKAAAKRSPGKPKRKKLADVVKKKKPPTRAQRMWKLMPTNGQLRYDRLRRSGGKHTTEQAMELLSAQGGLCALCSCELVVGAREKDHIRPVSKGGSDDISNIQWLCLPCNRRKSATWSRPHKDAPAALKAS